MIKLKNISAGMIFMMLFFALLAGCSSREQGSEGQAPGGTGNQMQSGERRINVEAAETTTGPIVLEKQYIGEIESFFSVDLQSTTSGWITSIKVDTGDRADKNAVICVIKHDDLEAQVEQAEANISVSRASVTKTEAELERIQVDMKRTESLYEKGYISKRELEQAQTAQKQALAELDSAKGQLSQSEAQLKNIKLKLRDTTIKAPFSGFVAERYVDPGAYVSSSNPIVKLVDDSKVKAIVNVVEEDFPIFHEGDQAVIMTDSYPGEKFTGEIVRIAPELDKVSRTAMVEILLQNPNRKLRGGMTARVNLVSAKNPSALKIPDTALRKNVETGENFVFIISEDTASLKIVKTGIIAAGEVEIVEGLEPGEAVITSDTRLSDGMKVERIMEEGGSR
ncbi:MAG TPA: efflux RND transporter periplasmic adaptor subunit [bacterium]|nr:efflux RND transporter periplasmic adaptor subunit [bacterium]